MLQVDLLLEGTEMDSVLALASDAEAHLVESDLVRIQEVWQLYRKIIPADETDEAVALATILGDGSALPFSSR